MTATSEITVSIRDRAAAAAAAREAADQEYIRTRAEADRASAIKNLTWHVERCLGVSIDANRVAYQTEVKPFARIEIEGLIFGLNRDGRFPYDRDDSLCVRLECARGCREPLWVSGFNGPSQLHILHDLLSTPQQHGHDCLVVHDEDGNPITDRDGNPLPPRSKPEPKPSPSERAEQAIAAVEAAAGRLAEAIRTVQDLEDARCIEKSAAIRRLMQTMNDETNKLHSASSAEKVVESDAEYLAYRRRQADAEVEKHRAYGAYDAAKLRARLECEMFIIALAADQESSAP